MSASLQHVPTDPLLEWLYHVGPVGLVIGPNIIREEDLAAPSQTAVDTAEVAARVSDEGSALQDPWNFFSDVLGWEKQYVAGASGGPELPPELTVSIPEHEIALSPDWAVRELGEAGGYQILVSLHPDLVADTRGTLEGWEASPHQRLERLLRETEIPIGVLVSRNQIRLVYAPRGETSGWLSFPISSLATVAGRAMLGGLKLMLGHSRLFTEPEHRRLPLLFSRSREAQNKVSEELAGQVLGALHELLRAFHAADPERIEELASTRPQHLYEGLLTTLMRLVFLLYAEDRDLIPTARDGKAIEIYESGYSVGGLYARLSQDRALHPDTMDERVGGWGQLLALFRLVHSGHPSGWITARGGKLFDPDTFPFLEGRQAGEPLNKAQVLPIQDGAILRILEGLMTIEARSINGERVRERLSYRSLDVEQIGSVYETAMGFAVHRAAGPMIAVRGEKSLPVFVNIDALAEKKPTDRQKLLKEIGVSPTGKRLEAIKKTNGNDDLTAALVAIVDERGSPGGHITSVGAPILQPTDERRRTGSHYTPRSLTEPIVRHALEQSFERIGADATPDQVLEIKVCDPACGSGAFLVEACRQLGARLEKSWARHPELKPAIPADEDDALHARRLVAQRCLYGVDKNPMAVDLARLSLWLATLAREHEFTFLDHAIKCGDSLVGLTQRQIEAVRWGASEDDLPLLRGLIKDNISAVVLGRRDIQFAPDDVTRAIQEARHKHTEEKLVWPRVYGDAIVAAFFSADRARARETKRQEVESLLSSGSSTNAEKLEAIARQLKQGEHSVQPFHWHLEFPEVFSRDNPGFDAIVGNPPFAGKNTIIGSNRKGYLDWLVTLHPGSHGNSDLVAHFFRRAFGLIRNGGAFGLIATNTIGQGDTRETGLKAILQSGGAITHAVKRLQWPGAAAVVVSIVHVLKGETASAEVDGRQVSRVSAYLVDGDFDTSPFALKENSGNSFIGSYLLGMGFTFDEATAAKGAAESLATMRALIEQDPRNQERIFPYIGGEEVNTSPMHAHHRYVIDFADFPLRRDASLKSWFLNEGSEACERRQRDWLSEGVVPGDYPGPVAKDWPDLLEIVRRRVKPDRDGQSRKALRVRWWQYAEKRPGLYRAIAPLERVFVSSRLQPHHAVSSQETGRVYSEQLVVFASEANSVLATLQARPHELWVRFFSSDMGGSIRYTPSDCFETFPLPDGFETSPALETAGRAYHDHRAALMVARDEGMTKTYNRFHDATEASDDIGRLRELHAEMDRTVLHSYGWDDLADRAQPEFLSDENETNFAYQDRLFWPSDFRDEVLARLLKLNAERHQEEIDEGLVKDDRRTFSEDNDGVVAIPSDPDQLELTRNE